MSELISPIKFRSSELIHIAFDVNIPALGIESLENSASLLSVDQRSDVESDKGKLVAYCALKMKLAISQNEDAEKDVEDIVSFECTMAASAASPPMADDADLAKKILLANLVSFIWSKIRVLYETMCANTILPNGTSLPAIDPYALLDEESENEAEGQ